MNNNNFGRSILWDSIYNEKNVVNKQFSNFWEAMFSKGTETVIHVEDSGEIEAKVYNLALSQWYLEHEIPEEERWETEYSTSNSETYGLLNKVLEAMLGKKTFQVIKRLSREKTILLDCFTGFRGIRVLNILDTNYNPYFKGNRFKELSMNNYKEGNW